MGVPSYFRWLITRYEKTIIFTDLPRDRATGSIVLYLDFNGAIHPAVRSNPELKRADMNGAVCQYLENILNFVRPDEVYIAIDGVAPAAKMNQQRDRRYKSAKEAHHTRVLNLKYGKVNREDPVDFNMISPGTEFMDELQTALEAYIQTGAKSEVWQGLKKITLNGSNLPGEGEHKIMHEIRKRGAATLGVEHPIVYGLDADLIFLSMLNNPNIVLVRENTYFDKTDPEAAPYAYLDIRALTTIITRILGPATSLGDIAKMGVKNVVAKNADSNYKTTGISDNQRLLTDYTFLCFLLGNDFLPRLPSLRIRDDSLADLIVFYKLTAWRFSDYMITPDLQVNYDFFHEILTEIAHVENEVLVEQMDRRQKSIRRFHDKIRHMSDPYEREKEHANFIEDKYQDTILAGTPGWRIRYYTEHMNMRYTTDAAFREGITEICTNYMEGCLWVIRYYTGRPGLNWDYQYNFKMAPSAQDLRDFIRCATKTIWEFQETKPVTPYVQLMSILPPDSAGLLPKSLQAYLTDKNSAIHYMYPIEFKISYYANRFIHECVPHLPYIDRALLDRIVEKEEFAEREAVRNSVGQELIIIF